MAQIFKPYANTIASASVMLGAVLPFGLLIGGALITRSPSNTKATVPIDQPVPFSHRHHVQELGIDCRYCHNTVEEQPNAGVPATEVCMSCHSQIWTNSPMIEPVRDSHATGKPIQWVKVNVLPDFVYFDHSIHIKRGISCNTCHGAVQDMPITAKGKAFSMAWCVDCHMDPSRFLGEFGLPSKAGDHDDHDSHGANMLSPSEQVFALYHKISAGKKLDDNEWQIAEGHMQSAPKDETHDQLIKRLEERNINVSQLKDCWVCHR